uniref:CCDC144C-like coiled-coil domain-containing protein n=1 Tax=Leptobrachium leishanense TaxID=445787 RepID=A0A8C5MJL9_9ANUR
MLSIGNAKYINLALKSTSSKSANISVRIVIVPIVFFFKKRQFMVFREKKKFKCTFIVWPVLALCMQWSPDHMSMAVGNACKSHVNARVISQRPLESQMVQNLGNNLVSSSDSEEPWEERYEKMWVDNEKKEVKTHFKEVTAELKHKFGEITETKKKENIMSCDNLTNSKNTAHGGDLEDTPDSLLPQDNVDQGLDIAVFEETQMGPTPPNDQNTSSVPIVQVDANLHGCTSVSLDGRMDNVLVRSKDVNFNGSVQKHSDLRPPEQNEHDISRAPLQSPIVSPPSDLNKQVLDKQLKQDMQRFKNEVGMLQSVFLDLVKGNGQLQDEVVDCQTPIFFCVVSFHLNVHLFPICSLNLIKIEDIIRQYERSLQKETGRYALLADKVKSMETDHKDLQQLAERNRELTSRLEHQKVEWESDLNHLRFMLKQEEEKRKSAEMLYDKGRDQLRKKEDQCCKEMEEKQQLEMALRNMEREVRSLSNNVKKERHEAQRLLSQERNARALQEDFLNNLRRKNEEEEAARIIMTKTPAESSEREKDLLQRNRTLQDEITLSRQELEKVQRLNEEEKRQYAEDIDMLKERVDDLKRDLKVNEESLTQNLIQYNGQLNALRTEATIFCTKLEHEKQAKERLETELESLRSRLTSVLQELEKSQTSKTDTERSLQRERDEWMRSKDKLSYDLANSQENNKNLSQQLGKAEAKCNDLECELHRKGLSLQERVVLVESMQRELTQAQCRIKELESTLTLEKDQFNKSTIKQESAQERLAQVQNENLQLRQQLDDLQSKGVIKDKAVSDVQDRFTDIFGKLRSDTERQVFLVEERNKDLINKSNELREQIYRLETDKLSITLERESMRHKQLESRNRELQDELYSMALSHKKQERHEKGRRHLEDEVTDLKRHLDSSKMDQSTMESFKREIEEKGRQEVRQKLEDVNLFLQVSAAQDSLEQIRAATDASLRSQLESRIQDLETELHKIKSAQKESECQKESSQTELDRFKELYAEEMKMRKSLAGKLERCVRVRCTCRRTYRNTTCSYRWRLSLRHLYSSHAEHQHRLFHQRNKREPPGSTTVRQTI